MQANVEWEGEIETKATVAKMTYREGVLVGILAKHRDDDVTLQDKLSVEKASINKESETMFEAMHPVLKHFVQKGLDLEEF